MTKGTKIAVFVVVGLLVAAAVGYFVIKSAVEKIINAPETRAEIAKVVEGGLRNIIIRPKVTIQSLKLAGLSQVDIGQSSLSASGRTMLNGIGYARCSVIRLLISGSCKGELFLDFGNDGSLNLGTMVPRAVLEGGDVPATIRVNGTLTSFNAMALSGDKAAGKQVVDVGGGRITGTLDVTVKTGRTTTVNGRFNGDLKGLSLAANVAGHSRKADIDIPLAVGFDDKRLFFETPMRANLFGNAIEYAGELKFEREPVWAGSVTSKGQSPLQNYIPNIFRCKTKPGNPINFRITGPVSNPQCR